MGTKFSFFTIENQNVHQKRDNEVSLYHSLWPDSLVTLPGNFFGRDRVKSKTFFHDYCADGFEDITIKLNNIHKQFRGLV